MSDPWMKWYPSDWRGDPGLQSCSLVARGLWIEMLGLMHDAEPYGHLVINGNPVSISQLSKLVNTHHKTVIAALKELDRNGVYSTKDGIIFSRKMVRDKDKYLRDKDNGVKGGNPRLTKGVNPPDNGGDKAQIPEARDQIPEKKTHTAKAAVARDEKFESAWQVYPRRDGGNPKAPAAKRFLSAVKAGADPQEIIEGIKRFAIAEQRNIGTPYIPQMVKWLGDQRWIDYGPDCSIVKFDIRKHLI